MSFRALEYINYQEYLQTQHFRRVRRETLRLAGYKCILCGGRDNLQCHHIDAGYQHLFEETPGVHTQCICKQCHEELSVGREVLSGAPANKGLLPEPEGASKKVQNGLFLEPGR